MAFQVSPGVNVSEIDLTTVVPSVSTTAAATVGQFQWGPAGKRRLITSENELANVFGKPDSNTATSFFSAANFLAYGNNLQVVRAANTTSYNATSNANNTLVIANEDVYDTSYTADQVATSFVARYQGAIGNSLKVAVYSANDSLAFASWAYKSFVPSAPSTSTFVSGVGGANDQVHVVVVDEDGLFSNGVKDTVLEVFPYMSKAINAVSDDGSSVYYRNVIRQQSRYVYALGPVETGSNWGSDANTSFTGVTDTALANGISLAAGTSVAVATGDITNAIALFDNKEEVDVSLLVSGDASTTVQQAWIDLALTRKDCIAFVSPPSTVTTSATPVTVVTDWATTTLNRATSFAVADSGWKYQFDKYNNVYRFIPLNADIAGLCVRTDLNNDPWFSPAGFNRGQIKNVVRLAWNPSQAQRDALYGAGVNPVASFPGQGTLLFGDKTLLRQPSAFDRINVRRLFIVLEKAIANAARFSLFELNDETTRAQFVGLVEPFLRDVKGRRGITDFRVVCDATNNTAQVIDTNRFVGDIYIKPARSINYIQLNFIAVRSGVQFSEIAGSL
jgi:phage tail sheath protein FI